MSKLYNTQADFASTFNEFINCVPFLRKTQLNILPHTIWGIINSESSVAFDITKHIKLFFYDSLIRHVIANYKKKHKDNSDSFKESLILEGIKNLFPLLIDGLTLLIL